MKTQAEIDRELEMFGECLPDFMRVSHYPETHPRGSFGIQADGHQVWVSHIEVDLAPDKQTGRRRGAHFAVIKKIGIPRYKSMMVANKDVPC